jgi:predicted ester cyclase
MIILTENRREQRTHTGLNLEDVQSLKIQSRFCVVPSLTFMRNMKIISQDSKVVFVGNVTGTHKGNFFFIPPTGNKISYEAVHIHTIGKDRKIVEHKAIRDYLKFMMQLGVIKLHLNLSHISKVGKE